MARIEPKPSTIKKLFALSGNQCTFEGCSNSLIDNSTILGEICHIEAAEEGGPRYNKDSNDEQRRSYDNLILMCPNCHKIIDSDADKYTAQKLSDWKKGHESKFQNIDFQVSDTIIDNIIQNHMKQSNVNTDDGVQFNNQANKINIENQIGVQNIYNKSEDSSDIIDFGKDYRKVIKAFKDEIDLEIKNYPKEDIEYYIDKRLGNKRYLVYHIPIKLLKLRKRNGRIKADVKSFEKKNNREINEIQEQALLKDFLINNDKAQTEKLKTLIVTETQREPAIITCDGFLVNGNRRRAVFEELYNENHQDKQYETMKVVVLEQKVALIDIEKIENRFQLQDEGKSEYSGLNRALSIRDKEIDNYTLEAQLKDDPLHRNKKGREFDKVVKDYKSDYLNPLECADRYLRYFGNEGLYDLITDSIGSKEGRWQAFIEYSKLYYGVLMNESQRRKAKIQQDDIGKIEDIAFKLIRKRELGGLGSLYNIIRKLKDYMSNAESKKHLIKIVKDVDIKLPPEEMIDMETKEEISEKVADKKWGKYFEQNILTNLHQADSIIHNARVQEKPLDLIKQALKKLEHENLIIENITIDDINEAIDAVKKIQEKSDSLIGEMDKYRYKLKKGLKDHFDGN